MKTRTKDTIKKAAIVATGIAMIGAVAVLTSARVQSRFVEFEHEGSPVFVDKYVPETLREEFTSGIGAATEGFLINAGLLAERPAIGPVAWFAADRHYGVVGANDPLVRRRLSGRPSSDFVLFRSISTNFYANELVSKSVASPDGSYIFVNIDAHWRASLLHAYVHALAAANASDSVKAAFRLDQGFDPELTFAFRFVDETIALFSSDLLELAKAPGSIDAAWSSFPSSTKGRYADPLSDVYERETEIIMATYDMPQKTAEFYGACNSFASWLLEKRGREEFGAIARAFLSGGYESIDEPFASLGGLDAAVAAWKGNASVPR